jgi:hypothetical protein
MDEGGLLSVEESLDFIERMINKAKHNVADKSFLFLLCCWLVLVGSDADILFFWLAILLSCIIPGHLLRSKRKQRLTWI